MANQIQDKLAPKRRKSILPSHLDVFNKILKITHQYLSGIFLVQVFARSMYVVKKLFTHCEIS